MVLLVSSKVGMGYNCPMPNVYVIAQRARKINTYHKPEILQLAILHIDPSSDDIIQQVG